MLFQKMKYDITRMRWEGGKDLAVADTSCTYPLADVADENYLIGIEGRVVTAFSGIVGPVNIKVGTTPVPDAFIKSTSIESVGSFKRFRHLLDIKADCPNEKSSFWNVPDGIVTFTSDSGNLEDLTAGVVEIIVTRLIVEP